MDKPVKLHLGCYQKKIHGFINIDIREDVKPDLVDDVFTLDKIKDNSVDLIYACHVLEHSSFQEAGSALAIWYRKLKYGGILRLAVPDIEAVCEHFISYKDLDTLRAFLWGSQKHPYYYHKCGWTFYTISQILTTRGFKNIKKYDWRDTEHFYIDDYSQSYLPEIAYKSRRKEDRISGKLMSLNIEASKCK